MLTIPLYSFLFIYILFLAIFVAFSIMNFYHVVMTASFTLASFVLTFFTFTLTVLTLYFTWYLLGGVDWQTPITLFDSSWLTNTPFF
jgi:hypothetical protein